MGQCGCADGFGHYKFRGEGGWYVMRLYAGCHECDTPVGVEVYWVKDGERLADSLVGVEDMTRNLHHWALCGDGLYLALFDFHQLVRSEELKEIAPPSEYETTRDLVQDMRYAIRQAALATINESLRNT